jgi:branched-chain amino acid transport system permease protein
MNWKEYRLILFLIILLVGLGIIFSGTYWITVLIAIGFLLMNLIGLDLMYGYCGQVNFGHQGLYAIGAYTSAILVVQMGFPPIAALAVGIILTCIVAYLMAKILFRLKGYFFIIATMVFGLVIYYAAGAFEWTGAWNGMAVPNLSIGGLVVNSEIGYYCVVWTIALIMLIAALNITRGRIGRALKAISANETAAAAMGIDTTKYLVQIYVLGAAFASIAGGLLAHHERFIVPTYFSITTMIMFFIALCIGGRGTIWGSLLGATIVAMLPEFMYMFRIYTTLFYGVVFVLILTVLPMGLAGIIKSVMAMVGRRDMFAKLI